MILREGARVDVMVDALSIAVSGLMAQRQRLGVAASNIANVSTTGRIPTADNPSSTVYRPLEVSYAAMTVNGRPAGVSTQVNEVHDPYSVAYDPSSSYANSDGLVAAPNVDLVTESVNMLMAKNLFKANLSVIKTEKEMLGELLDTLT